MNRNQLVVVAAIVALVVFSIIFLSGSTNTSVAVVEEAATRGQAAAAVTTSVGGKTAQFLVLGDGEDRDPTDVICKTSSDKKQPDAFPSSFASLVLNLMSAAGVSSDWQGVFDPTLFHRVALEQRLQALKSSSPRAAAAGDENKEQQEQRESEVLPCAGLFAGSRPWTFNNVRQVVRRRPRCFANIRVALRTVKLYHSVALGRFAFDGDLNTKWSEELKKSKKKSSASEERLGKMARAASRFVAGHLDAMTALLQILIDANILPLPLRPNAAESAAGAAVRAAGIRISADGLPAELLALLPKNSQNPVMDILKSIKVDFPSSSSDSSSSTTSEQQRLIQQLSTSLLKHRDAISAATSSSSPCRPRLFTHPRIDRAFAHLRAHSRLAAALRYDTHFYKHQRPPEGKYWNLYRPFVACSGSAAVRTCEIPEGCRFVCNAEFLVRRFFEDARVSAAVWRKALPLRARAVEKAKLAVAVDQQKNKGDAGEEEEEEGQQQQQQRNSNLHSPLSAAEKKALAALSPTWKPTPLVFHEIVGVGSNNEFDWEESLIIMYRRLNPTNANSDGGADQDGDSSSSSALLPARFTVPLFSIFDCTVRPLRPSRGILPPLRRNLFRFLPYCVAAEFQAKSGMSVGDVVRPATFGRDDAALEAKTSSKFFPLSGLVPALRIADQQARPTAARLRQRVIKDKVNSILMSRRVNATVWELEEVESTQQHRSFMRTLSAQQRDLAKFFSAFDYDDNDKDVWRLRRSPVRQIDILKVDAESFEFVAIPEWTVRSFARIGDRFSNAAASSKSSKSSSNNGNNNALDDFLHFALSHGSSSSWGLHHDSESLGYRIDQFQYELHRLGWTQPAAAGPESLLATYTLQLQLMAQGFAVFASERNHLGTCCYEVAMVHGRYFVLSEIED